MLAELTIAPVLTGGGIKSAPLTDAAGAVTGEEATGEAPGVAGAIAGEEATGEAPGVAGAIAGEEATGEAPGAVGAEATAPCVGIADVPVAATGAEGLGIATTDAGGGALTRSTGAAVAFTACCSPPEAASLFRSVDN